MRPSIHCDPPMWVWLPVYCRSLRNKLFLIVTYFASGLTHYSGAMNSGERMKRCTSTAMLAALGDGHRPDRHVFFGLYMADLPVSPAASGTTVGTSGWG